MRRYLPADLWVFKFSRETGYVLTPEQIRRMPPRDIQWLMAERTAHEEFLKERALRGAGK